MEEFVETDSDNEEKQQDDNLKEVMKHLQFPAFYAIKLFIFRRKTSGRTWPSTKTTGR